MTEIQIQIDRLVRKKELKNILGITSDATVDTWERTLPGFPRRRRITGGVVAWLQSEILEWLKSRPVGKGRKPNQAIEARRGA